MEFLSSLSDANWLIWLGVSVALLIAELAMPAFILIFFSCGALVAGGFSFLGTPLQGQIIIFGISSCLLLFFVRKHLAAIFRGETAEGGETDSAIGASVEVVEDITSTKPGRIKFQGTFWNAISAESIEKGTSVEIVSRAENDANTFNVMEKK